MPKKVDYDAELKALEAKVKVLKAQRTLNLGRLVEATGAGDLDVETLVGILLGGMREADPARREAWRTDGAAFFQRGERKAQRRKREGGAGAEAASSSQAQS